jgi:hypothetical protein
VSGRRLPFESCILSGAISGGRTKPGGSVWSRVPVGPSVHMLLWQTEAPSVRDDIGRKKDSGGKANQVALIRPPGRMEMIVGAYGKPFADEYAFPWQRVVERWGRALSLHHSASAKGTPRDRYYYIVLHPGPSDGGNTSPRGNPAALPRASRCSKLTGRAEDTFLF